MSDHEHVWLIAEIVDGPWPEQVGRRLNLCALCSEVRPTQGVGSPA